MMVKKKVPEEEEETQEESEEEEDEEGWNIMYLGSGCSGDQQGSSPTVI